MIKNFAIGEMGLASGGIAFLLSFIMPYAHSPYDRAGTYYIYIYIYIYIIHHAKESNLID